MNIEEYEQIQPWATNAGIKFFTPNRHCLWRVETLLTKEPDTIAWINSMSENSVFLDIGANMGQYSLYAAKRGCVVHAFEPESQNFALLQRNIFLNDMLQQVTAWPICVSNEAKLAHLHLSSLIAGGSCHAFDNSLDYHGQQKQFPVHQGSISITLNDFLDTHYNSKRDHYLKIDVDGFEHFVIQGVINYLTKFKSVLIEINTHYPEHLNLITFMQDQGFTYQEAQAKAARRTEGPFTGIGNIIFYREIDYANS